MRVSGLLLVVLAESHVLIMHVVDAGMGRELRVRAAAMAQRVLAHLGLDAAVAGAACTA